jgi:hypothetical protein
VVDKVALGQVFSEYFSFACQFLFHRLLHIHHPSSGAGTIGQLEPDVPSVLSLTPPQEIKKKKEAKIAGGLAEDRTSRLKYTSQMGYSLSQITRCYAVMMTIFGVSETVPLQRLVTSASFTQSPLTVSCFRRNCWTR